MSSLYRCRARVAYKPFKSERVIVFEERQIQDLQVKLKGNNTFSSLNSQGNNSAEAYAASIAQSKCQVTLSDPYLTGIAWPALFDAASQWSASNTAQTNNILLPPCGKNEDPVRNKCFRYSSIDSSALISSSGSAGQLSDSFAHIIISLWYDVNGTSFGTDYYFRVNRISINHGGNFPSVTLSGTEPRAVVFNQNLINVKFDEGMSVEEALKKIAEENGYKTSFCVPPGGDTASPYILPRSLIYKGVTPDEAMKRLIGATGGSMLSLPVKEYGNRVSVCSRGEITSSCTVFYLGKGLYESYVIDGEPPDTFANQNSQTGATINDGDPYVSASFAADKYSIKEVIKEKRIKALEKVKKVTFPDLFKSCEPRCQGQLADGYGWSGEGPAVQNTRYTKSNFYGVAPNGTQAISYLPGKVESASEEEGKVVIKTEMWFQICKDDKSEKCFGRYIYQESSNLTKVKIKRGDELKVSQEIGSSTDSKKELVRFYIQGHSQGDFVTIDPRLIWNWSAPAETSADFQNKNAPTSKPQPPASTDGLVIGKVGSTGSSSGPHLHAEWADRRAITVEQVREFVNVPGVVTSPYNDPSRSRHKGVDIGGNDRAPIRLINGASVVSVGESKCTVENSRNNNCGGGFGNFVTINTPKGQMILAHLAPETIPPNLPGLTSSSSSGNVSPTISQAPSNKSLTIETSFKGIPRALRITPGRTILSFITDYDKWVDNNGHKGGDNSTDPGVWIPNRFRNWFINEVEYLWRQGDLEVNLQAANPWGNSIISAPTFAEYLSGQRKAGEFEKTNDYYGYIRSIGDLCFPITKSDGKLSSSCKELCKEAQEFYRKFGADTGTPQDAGAGDGSGSFPVANCQYTGTKYPTTRVNNIINAARSAGINTQAGFAGVIGNALVESGVALSPTAENPTSKAYGVFQWLGGRKEGLEKYATSKGRPVSDFGVQMERFVQELNGADFQGKATVQALNSASNAATAAREFNRLFERAPGQKEKQRQDYANEIFPQLKCVK